MAHSRKVGIEFYEFLGKLFYSVAMADGNVHKKETARLRDIVRDDWLGVDDIEDSFHSDAAYQIETVFDWLLENEISSEQTFGEFSEFYRDHPQLFPEPVKKLILDTANAIAYAFSARNKSELILLGKLVILFKG